MDYGKSTTILYALIAAQDGSTVAECSNLRGSYGMNAKKIITNLLISSGGSLSPNEKKCFEDNRIFYSIINDGTYIFLIATDESFDRVRAFNTLEQIQKNAGKGRKSQSEVNQQLKRDVEYFSDPNNDKFAKIKKDINLTRNAMVDNLDKILDRGERIDNLVNKTENLEFESRRFESSARDLKWKMWKRRIIMTLIVVFVVFIVIFILVLWGCSKDGVNFKKCGQK